MQILRRTEDIIHPAAAAAAASAPHPTMFRLSETDQLRRALVCRLYFYKQGPPSSEALKSSLAKTLAFFYPLAGRLVERTTCQQCEGTCSDAVGGCGGSTCCGIAGRVDVSCLDEGALFCEAWTDTRLNAYEPDFQPHPDFRLLVAPGHDDFLLRVQMTHFSCGGICLCVQDHHCLVDGVSSAHFMKCWVEITNGEEIPSTLPYISHPPLEVMYRSKNLHYSCIDDYSAYYQPSPSNVSSNDTQEVPRKIFHFTPNFIDNLKCATSHENCKYSSFECITAYIWKIITIARGIASNEEVCLYYPVNGRGKLEPPLPPGFGNVVFRTHASSKVSDLVEKPLSHIAHLLRLASSKVTDAHMRSVMKWSTGQPLPMSTTRCLSPHIFLNTWRSFPFYDFDFGWGTPSRFRAQLNPFEFVFLLPSSLGQGHIEALIALNKEHMNNLDSLLSQTPLY